MPPSVQCPLDETPQRDAGPATLLIRPDGAKIVDSCAAAPDSRYGRVVVGRVLRRRFQGSRYSLNIECGAASLSFELPLDPPPPETGNSITLAIQSSALIVLDNKEDA